MQVKTFRAPSISQALDQVKKDLGPNAIILGNKKISVSPGESYIELMAAVEPEGPDVDGTESSGRRTSGRSSQIQSDIQEIKSFLSLLISSKDYFSQLQMHQPLAEIYHSLLTRGLDEKHTFILLRKAISRFREDGIDKRQIVEGFCRQLFAKIKFARPFHNLSASQRSPHVFTFLGSTGVGKTTTLAKLAAYLKIKREMEVGIISIDTYRIGAVDQLQTYANILGIPLMVAQNKSELNHAREKLRHQDVVLVDTIGKNYLNQTCVEDLRAVFNGCDTFEHFLVLSATAKDGDLKQTIAHFLPVNIHSLIFTKVDETLSHGSIINQLLHFPYPISYLGTGQRVPEDIELATQKRLLAFLFPVGTD